MVTAEPSSPELPEVPATLVIAGAAVTVKAIALVLTPSTTTVTFTDPGVTPEGTIALRKLAPV